MANLTTWIPDENDEKESCPVLNGPEPDCYCLSLNSLDVPLAIQFCLRDFRECPIYKRYTGVSEYRCAEGCPVLDAPDPDCYCFSLTSFNVPKIVQFCLKDFRECPIYKRSVQGAPGSQTDRAPCA